MKIRYSQAANILLYFVVLSYVIDIGNLKYVFAYLATALLLGLNLLKNGSLKLRNFNYEFQWLIAILSTFVLVTIIKQMSNGFNSYFLNEIIYFVTPILFVYAFLQLQDEYSIFKTLDGLFLIFCIAFFVKTWGQLNFENISKISFSDTYSPFEGTGLAFIFVPFIFYFYYRKNMPLEIVSFLFVFLTMKRLAFITGIVIIVLSILTKGKRTSVYKLNRVFVIIPCVAFVLLPLITNVFLNDAFASWFFEKTGLNINLFTMGRFERLNLVTDNHAGKLGWGSTTTYLSEYYTKYHNLTSPANFNLHNDIYKIYLETGLIGTGVFTIGFFKMCKRNYLSVLFVVYLFLEMYVNHELGAGTVHMWILFYLLIFCFNCRTERRMRFGKSVAVDKGTKYGTGDSLHTNV